MSFSRCDMMSTSYVCRMHITGFDIRYLDTCWLYVNRCSVDCSVDLRSSPVMGQCRSTRTISSTFGFSMVIDSGLRMLFFNSFFLFLHSLIAPSVHASNYTPLLFISGFPHCWCHSLSYAPWFWRKWTVCQKGKCSDFVSMQLGYFILFIWIF
jgi:hypothetical protein